MIPKLHIIILNYLSYNDTIVEVEQLLKQQNVILKVVIVDNFSPNKSYQVLSEKFQNSSQVKVIQSLANDGYSSGNNIGLRAIKSDNPEYVAILNNDLMLADEQLFSKLINELKTDTKAYFCSPKMVVNGEVHPTAFKIPTIFFSLVTTLKLGDLFFSKLKYEKPQNLVNQKVECLPGSFFVGEYATFERLGFFDERTFLFEEEAILAYKIKQLGGHNLLCNQLEFEHVVSHVINQVFNRINKLKEKHKSINIFYKYHVKPSLLLQLLLISFQKIRILQEQVIFQFKKISKAKP